MNSTTLQLFIKPIQASNIEYIKLKKNMRLVQKNIETGSGLFEIQGLNGGTIYELVLKAFGAHEDGIITSDKIVFKTLQAKETPSTGSIADPMECVIVISILIAWLLLFAIFVHKWGTIRIVQHGQYRPQSEPMNLKSIKVVKKPTDSVIYRSHSQKFNRTLRARERKIERMNTMPNMCINQQGLLSSPKAVPKDGYSCTFVDDLNNGGVILKNMLKCPSNSLPLQGHSKVKSFGTFSSVPHLSNTELTYVENMQQQQNFSADDNLYKYMSEPLLTKSNLTNVSGDYGITIISSLREVAETNEID